MGKNHQKRVKIDANVKRVTKGMWVLEAWYEGRLQNIVKLVNYFMYP